MQARIVLLPGDGIGPEIVEEARLVMDVVAKRHGHSFSFDSQLIGGAAIDATGQPLPAATLEAAKGSAAVLLGAVGGPKWDDPQAKVRPEQGLLGITFNPNGQYLYTYITDGNGDVRVYEFPMAGGGRRELLFVEHSSAGNHNGGGLQFGPVLPSIPSESCNKKEERRVPKASNTSLVQKNATKQNKRNTKSQCQISQASVP